VQDDAIVVLRIDGSADEMSDGRLARLEVRVERLETTVHDGFEHGLRTDLGRQIHDLGLRLDHVRDELRTEFGHGLQTLRQDLQTEMREGFGSLDAKLDEFISTQAAFNRWVMARLGGG
jgi:hypothetical protein